MKKKSTSIISLIFLFILIIPGISYAEGSYEIEAIDPETAGQVRNTSYLPFELNELDSLGLEITAAQLESLSKYGETSYYYKNGVLVSMSPPSINRENLFNQLGRVNPTIGVESLFVIPLKELGSNSAETRFLELFNQMHQFQTMEGIEYFSDSRQRMRIFYIVSHLVAEQDKDKRLSDPVFNQIISNQNLLLFQEDASFGENFYDLDIETAGNRVSLTMTNASDMYYSLIRVAEAGGLQIHLSIEEIDDYLVFYGNIAVNAMQFLGIEDRAKQSFYNRIVALFNWYVSRLRSQNLIEF
jgi:hypothetical protein